MKEKEIYEYIYELPYLHTELMRIEEELEKGAALSKEDRALLDSVLGKVDKVEGKGLSTNDYDDVEKKKVEDLVKDIEELKNPYKKPTVSISTSTSVFEKYTTSDIIVDINAIKGKNDIVSIKVYNGNTLVGNVTSETLKDGGKFRYTIAKVNVDSTIYVVVNDGVNNIASNSLNLKFVFPSFYGCSQATEITGDIVKIFTKVPLLDSNFKYDNITCEDARIIYAFPVSCPILTSIKDPNGFEYLDSYTKVDMTINSIPYTCYYTTDKCNVEEYSQTFTA